MIIPSIDLMAGKAVQLVQGREKVLERSDVHELAKEFNRYAETAVIDLDAALGKGDNLSVIKSLVKIADCRVGGGIRNIDQIKELISLGAKKIIIGSKAFEGDRINYDFLQEVLLQLGKQFIIIAVDIMGEHIVTDGWKHSTNLDVYDAIPKLEPYCSEFLVTAVEKEGLMQGMDVELIEKVVKLTKNKVTVAGGVSELDEIRSLSKLRVNIQVGMALYTNKINLKDAFIESLDWGKGLVPIIVQDEDGNVLMVAYGNKESLHKTFDTERMWYYSRSRRRLWKKGESSGNEQEFIKFRSDCDDDALLAMVKQKNFACHTGAYSCFGDRKFTLNYLHSVILDRLKNPRENSYTATLTDDLLRGKLLEEINELIEARSEEEIVWEVADVLYFITVYLAKNRVDFSKVLKELYRRHMK